MSDADPDDGRRGAQLLPVLFWAGVGLAPLAVLLHLVGSGGTLRLGVVLGLISVVLIGTSIALRPDSATVRLQMEETLLEELDVLRAEVREEIATSARATHQMVGERMGALQQTVDGLRAQRAATAAPPPQAPPPPQAAPPPPRAAPPPPQAAPRAAAARSAVPPGPATPRSAAPQPGGFARSGAPRATPRSAAPQAALPPGPPPAQGVAAPSSAPAGRHSTPATAPPAGNGRGSAVPSGGRRGAAGRRRQPDGYRPPSSGRAAPPAGGVYRHTETVQVTTRSTYVDENGVDRGRRYDGGYGSQDWTPQGSRGRGEPDEESWTDRRLRERYGSRRPRPFDRSDDPASSEPWQRPISGEPISGEPLSAEPVSRGRRRRRDDDSSTDLRASSTDLRASSTDLRASSPDLRASSPDLRAGAAERWAALRSDDNGRELQLGERRSARHSSDRGSELRYEDRWASVRQEEDEDDYGRNGYGGGDYGTNGYGYREYGGNGNGYGGNGHGGNGHGRPDYSRPALPATSSEPSWNDWDEPVREARSHRYRPDFELTDERWR